MQVSSLCTLQDCYKKVTIDCIYEKTIEISLQIHLFSVGYGWLKSDQFAGWRTA